LGERVPRVVDMMTKAKLITVTHIKERVENGMPLGVSANSHAVGLLAGEKAARVLRGAKPTTIPIGTVKKFDVFIKRKTAKKGQFQIPPNFMKTITQTIE
jgi:ABC-type uncharacterized transport system substrate-binding protein